MKLFSKIHIVILIHTIIATAGFFLSSKYEEFLFFISPFYVLAWLVIRNKIKLDDDSVHYIVALLYSSIAITIASLSCDEIQIIMKISTFQNYFWNKIVLNLLGWVGLPLATAELIKLSKQEPKTRTKNKKIRKKR